MELNCKRSPVLAEVGGLPLWPSNPRLHVSNGQLYAGELAALSIEENIEIITSSDILTDSPGFAALSIRTF